MGIAIVKPMPLIAPRSSGTEGCGFCFITLVPSVFSHHYTSRIIAQSLRPVQQVIHRCQLYLPYAFISFCLLVLNSRDAFCLMYLDTDQMCNLGASARFSC